MSDDAIRRRTGHGWEHWFDLIVYARVYPSAADAMAAFEGRGA